MGGRRMPELLQQRDTSWMQRATVRELLAWKRRQGADALDCPEMTLLHGELIRRKPLLRKFYQSVYRFFRRIGKTVPPGLQLEIGSGGGFLKQYIPHVITSDVLDLPGVDRVFSGTELPYPDESISAIYLMNVLHHIPDVEQFLDEVSRTLRPGGALVAFEPANTWWSRFIYRRFHHEPFVPEAAEWRLPSGGPLSLANGALPWIVFVRDLARFERRFPALEVTRVRPGYPF